MSSTGLRFSTFQLLFFSFFVFFLFLEEGGGSIFCAVCIFVSFFCSQSEDIKKSPKTLFSIRLSFFFFQQLCVCCEMICEFVSVFFPPPRHT